MSLAPIESGEVIVLDPVDFLQFAGIGGAAKGVSAIVKPVLKKILANPSVDRTLIKSIKPMSEQYAKINPTITDKIKSALSKPVTKAVTGGGAIAGTVGATTIPKQVTQVVTSKGISVVEKVATRVAATAGFTSVGLGLITLTPQGQKLSNDAANLANKGADIGKNLSEFMKANGQLFSIFLIVGGAALLIGAIKK